MEINNDIELLGILRSARVEGKTVSIVGTGTHSRKSADLIVSTLKMSDFEIKGGEVVAQAGASVTKIREEAMSSDLLFPSLYDGTVGGLLALNEAYPISTGYGTPYSFTQWAKVVTPVGILKWRGLIGSKGLLGGFTEASMKLYPRPHRVVTFTKRVETEELIKLYGQALGLKPLAFLVEYDNGYRLHVSLSEGELEGLESYEGVPVVEESDRGSYMVKTEDLSSFMELMERVKPIYAYYIHGVKWSKVYTSEENELNGWEYFPTGDVPGVVKKLKRVLDHWNTLV
ncbi:hypothetical protein L3N51_00480 [Metallosphaera sp. J1]|uniref:FAD-binding protein n=1 Tax=Metallosphaera javensis (ex Hofmann et al. 2022) TaxID=99938 RepID=UPI001EDDE08B|nr:FAD-binding protein [Metallosphaera javensis (ex Hofmann et al. 2022)]MCG3108199.1 hypothetical protein [Metallosphaera javensis (ex Hofmann et al. 2022)]